MLYECKNYKIDGTVYAARLKPNTASADPLIIKDKVIADVDELFRLKYLNEA